MAYVNQDNPNCVNCNKSGLAILPVRYAVVPIGAAAQLPASLGNKVTNISLKQHKYALRTLRKGYLYLYYEKHARGRHIKWEVYSVAAGGTLWKQISIAAITEVTEVLCSRKAHLVPASTIAIDMPEKCGRVWMAFSEHIWREETFRLFEQDITLRDRRMQTFAPALWIKQKSYRHGLEATEQNLNEVVEYRTGFVLSALGGTDVKTISQPDGSFNKDVLYHCSTMHPMTVRRDDKSRLVDTMKKAGECGGKTPYMPIIIALWDSVGITHELNGFRNDAAGWIQKYGMERQLEIGAAVSIEGARRALEGKARVAAEPIADFETFHWDAEKTRARMERYDSAPSSRSADRDRLLDLCARWEHDAVANAPAHLARRRSLSIDLSDQAWQTNMAEIDVAIISATIPNSTSAKGRQARDARAQSRVNDTVAEAWPKYESLIDRAELNSFLNAQQAFLAEATRLVDARTEDVVAWLKSTALQDGLTDFHFASIDDGIAFEATVGSLIYGITSSPSGHTYINELIEEAKCSERNLIWRAIAFNQRDASEELDGALGYISSIKDKPFSETALAAAENFTKYLAKLAQLVSKALSLHNALHKVEVKPVRTGGHEKILLGIGGLFMRPYIKNGVDTLAGWLIHGLIFVRSGSDYGKVMALLIAEAKFGKTDRAQTILLLTVGNQFAKASAAVGRKVLQEKWGALVRDVDVPKSDPATRLGGGFNEARELRFAIVASLFQVVYFAKLYFEIKNDPNNKKLQGEVWAAGISLSASIADIAAIGTKITSAAKDKALTYQGLKLAGGFLSVGAAWINFYNAMADGRKNAASEQYGIANLYYMKAALNAAGGLVTAINSFSYTKPALELLVRKFPSTGFSRGATIILSSTERFAGRMIFRRALLLLCGMEVSIALLAIDLLLWKFSEDALQKWCRGCAFGKIKNDRTLGFESQKTGFDAALQEVI